METRIAAVAFDIIGTVFALDGLRERMTTAGLPPAAPETWIAQTLRDALALEVTETFLPFREIASGTLAALMAKQQLPADPIVVEHLLDGFAELSVRPDAESAFRQLQNAGIRIAALTNGSAHSTHTLLRGAGLETLVEQVITIEEVHHWKPRRAVYLHAADRLGLEPHALALASHHPWDIHGAAHAGLRTAYAAYGQPFPQGMAQPDLQGATLVSIAHYLIATS